MKNLNMYVCNKIKTLPGKDEDRRVGKQEKRLCLVLREIKEDAESRREYDKLLVLLVIGVNNKILLLLPEI